LDELKAWMETVAFERPYVFQQNGTLTHTSHLIQNWLSDNVDVFWFNEFWFPNSPDLNAVDCYVCSVVERDTNKSRHSNVTWMRDHYGGNIRRRGQRYIKACERFRSRIEVVKLMENISNNCALQRSHVKCHVKGLIVHL